MRTRAVLLAGLSGVFVLGGCSSGVHATSDQPSVSDTSQITAAADTTPTTTACSSSTSSTTTGTTLPGSTTASTSASQTTVSTPPTGASLPAVTGATDLAHEPKVASGGAVPPCGLETQDLVTGTGVQAGPDSTVNIQYVGTLFSNGQIFDASWSRGQPASFPLANVVPGFKQGIIGMRIGGRREIVIPPDLGYGAQGSPPAVPGNATLVFVVDLLGVS